MIKKSFIIIFIIIAGVTFGIFIFNSGKTTFYVKNSAPRLSAININQKIYQAEDRIGDLTNNIIPKINIPGNLTENFNQLLAKEIINKNNQPRSGLSTAEQGLNVPDPDKIAQDFIKNGLKTANENIVNIKPVQLTVSQDNSKNAIEDYILGAQIIIKEGLDPKKISLSEILDDLNKNDGAGFVEKLTPVIIAHEGAANKLEEKPVPADLKELMTEEIRLLRITANIFKAIVNVEEDPLATITAIKQFETMLESWINLQNKFDAFIKKLNQAR